MSLQNEIFKVITEASETDATIDIFQKYALYRHWYKGHVDDFHCISVKKANGNTIQRTRYTLNMAKKVCTDWTSLLFGESVQINISNPTISDRVHEILNDNNFSAEFPKLIEKSFAIGMGATVQYINKNSTRIDYIVGDLLLPISWRNSTITEIATINSFSNKRLKFNLITKHLIFGNDYVVENVLFARKSENKITELGDRVDLHNFLPDLASVIVYKDTKPFFQLIQPNEANNQQMGNPMTLSIFANAIDNLKAIDIKYDSYSNEFINGKKRLVVASEIMQQDVDDNGKIVKFFDEDDTIYDALPAGLSKDGAPVQQIDFSLRVNEHMVAINQELSLLANQVGLGKNFYSFDKSGVKTATEVVSENSDTFRNKKKHELVLKTAITDMVNSIVYIETNILKTLTPAEFDINVFFDDSIIEDRGTQIKEGIELVQNKLESKLTFMTKRMGLTEAQARKELLEIQAEQQFEKETEEEEDLGEAVEEAVEIEESLT